MSFTPVPTLHLLAKKFAMKKLLQKLYLGLSLIGIFQNGCTLQGIMNLILSNSIFSLLLQNWQLKLIHQKIVSLISFGQKLVLEILNVVELLRLCVCLWYYHSFCKQPYRLTIFTLDISCISLMATLSKKTLRNKRHVMIRWSLF